MDLQLVELLQQVRRSPKRDPRALTRLLTLIPKLPGLRRDRHPDYLEALNHVLKYVQTRIDRFQCDLDADPSFVRQRFTVWVNGQLKFRILDLYRGADRPLSLDAPVAMDSGNLPLLDYLGKLSNRAMSLDGIEALIEERQLQATRRQGLLVELYIERDPEGRLQSCTGTQAPHMNCQTLAQSILLQTRGDRVGPLPAEKKNTWRSLARQLQVNEQTLHSHWKRRCYPMLKAIAQDILARPAQVATLLGIPSGSGATGHEEVS
ncbi:MAG: hypothetical protein EA001_10270 [Oscillatoriales cyanobacterium]|nr:MAG: hypothetical protein EA001_10270 [Oscillatoriales cyanobacterium]